MKVPYIILFLLIVGGIVFALRPKPEPEVILPKDTDTGFTRHETEELMRTIGYVQ